MTTRLYSLVGMALISASCGKLDGNVTANRAVEITDQAWAEDVPQLDLDQLATRVEDLGDRWRVIYYHPEGSTGGPWVFLVNKKSGEIVSAKGGQ